MANSNITNCITAAQSVLKTFTQIDLDKYVKDVYNKATEYDPMRGVAAIERAIKVINNDRAQMYMELFQTKVNDKAKFEERAKPIQNKKARLLDIITRRMGQLGDNLESAIRAASKTLMNKSFNLFTNEEQKFLLNKKNDLDLARAIRGDADASPIAQTLAKKYQDYIGTRNSEEVNSGAIMLANINKDREFRAIHNAAKLLRGGRNVIKSALSKSYSVDQARTLWKNYIVPRINLDKTFKDTLAMDINGKVDMVKAHAMLDEIFDNITTGKPFLYGGGKKQEMFFYWRDAVAWTEYNQTYGRGDMYKAWRADIQASSRRVGMANMFGSQPQQTYNALARLENESNAQNSTTRYIAKKAFDLALGHEGAPVSPKISAFMNAWRGVTGTARLAGKMTTLSLPDIANGIVFAKRHGADYFAAYANHLSGMFNLLKNEETKYIADLFHENVETHTGFMTRFINADDAGSIIGSFNDFMYRITGMSALDSGNKLSGMRMMARILGDNAHLEYNLLNDTAKATLEKFNITDNEWNGIRNNVKKIGKRKLLAIDAVDDLTNDDLRRIYGITNDRPLYQLRNDLYRKVYSMFDVASENSVLTPGAFLKASTHIAPGTVPGEIARSVLQYKMYSFEYIDRVLFQGFKESDGIKNKLKFAAYLFGATMPMSMLSMYLNNLANGKTMPDLSKMRPSQQVHFVSELLLQGVGNMAMFLDPEKQSPYYAAQYFSTPAIQLMYESLALPFKVGGGIIDRDPKKVKDAFKAIGKSVIPGQGLPFVSPYMRQMFGDKPYLQPGQKQLYGA